MNIDRLPPREVERRFADKFQELLTQLASPASFKTLLSRQEKTDQEVDIVVRYKSPLGPRINFLIECKTQARPGLVEEAPGERYRDIPSVAQNRRLDSKRQLEEVSVWVFAAPFVSPRLAEVCHDRGWSWYDLAGNCEIRVPGLLHIGHKGNPPVHQFAKPDANLGTPEAARVIRALLDPEDHRPHWSSQRGLQDETKPPVSLGLINKVLAHLRNEGHVVEVAGEGFRVVDHVKLLEAWRDAYRFDRIARVEWFTLLKEPEVEAALRRINLTGNTRVLWAAFSAAERQAPMVRQPKFWLMASDDRIDWAVDELNAKPVDSGANLVLLTAPDLGYLSGATDDSKDGPCTSLLQTYVDAWHAGSRGQEAATAVLERRLKPAWARKETP